PGAAVEYVCPMCPGVPSDKPGPCPRCGMALEPRTVSAEDGPDPELVGMTRRLVAGVVLGVPLAVLHIAGHVLDCHGGWWEGALATPIVFWCGGPFFARAWTSLRHASPNMFTLIGLGVAAAYAHSVAALLAPAVFTGLYFETAAALVVLALLGQVLELRARRHTAGAIRRLLGLAPKTARLVGP